MERFVAVATRDRPAGVWEVPLDGDAAQLVEMGGFPNDTTTMLTRSACW